MNIIFALQIQKRSCATCKYLDTTQFQGKRKCFAKGIWIQTVVKEHSFCLKDYKSVTGEFKQLNKELEK